MAKSKLSGLLPRQGLLAAVCGLAALYAAGLVYEMDFSRPGCCGLAWPHRDSAAVARWLAGADTKGRNPAAERRATQALLASEPANAGAWMRLAWAERLAHDHLTEAGAAALDMSYVVRPFASGETVWRTDFSLNNWSRLSDETRGEVAREIEIARTDSKHWQALRRAILRGASDPEGRKAATLLGLS